MKRAQSWEGKLTICKKSKERVKTCKNYVIGREITIILKIAVETVETGKSGNGGGLNFVSHAAS